MRSVRAKEIVDQFSGKYVLVIGDMALDRYVFGKVERLNPEAPVPILHAREEKVFSGAAGNTAKNAAALGAKVTFIGVVGGDQAAKRVAQAAADEGYEADLIVDDSRPTIEKIRYVVGSQQMFRVDYEEVGDVHGEVEEQVIEKIRERAEGVDAIIVSDYAKGVVTKRVAAGVMSTGKPVMADVKPSVAAFFKGATMISPNMKEGHEYLGLNHLERGGKEPAELAKMLRERYQASVFLTLSERGMYVYGEEQAHVPQEHEIEVADGSGCGDTAAVVLTLAKLAGASDVEAAELGNAAGAVIASKVGAVALTPKELLDMISHEHE